MWLHPSHLHVFRQRVRKCWLPVMLRGSQAVCPLQHVSNNCSLTRLTQPGLATEKWAPSTFVPVWSTRTVKTVPTSVTSPGSTDLHKHQSCPGDCRTIIFGYQLQVWIVLLIMVTMSRDFTLFLNSFPSLQQSPVLMHLQRMIKGLFGS